jgi:hypothetical protein
MVSTRMNTDSSLHVNTIYEYWIFIEHEVLLKRFNVKINIGGNFNKSLQTIHGKGDVYDFMRLLPSEIGSIYAE